MRKTNFFHLKTKSSELPSKSVLYVIAIARQNCKQLYFEPCDPILQLNELPINDQYFIYLILSNAKRTIFKFFPIRLACCETAR